MVQFRQPFESTISSSKSSYDRSACSTIGFAVVTASFKLDLYVSSSPGSSNTVFRIAATSAITAPNPACSDFTHPRIASKYANSSVFSCSVMFNCFAIADSFLLPETAPAKDTTSPGAALRLCTFQEGSANCEH